MSSLSLCPTLSGLGVEGDFRTVIYVAKTAAQQVYILVPLPGEPTLIGATMKEAINRLTGLSYRYLAD
jgi:hypothetical protein